MPFCCCRSRQSAATLELSACSMGKHRTAVASRAVRDTRRSVCTGNAAFSHTAPEMPLDTRQPSADLGSPGQRLRLAARLRLHGLHFLQQWCGTKLPDYPPTKGGLRASG